MSAWGAGCICCAIDLCILEGVVVFAHGHCLPLCGGTPVIDAGELGAQTKCFVVYALYADGDSDALEARAVTECAVAYLGDAVWHGGSRKCGALAERIIRHICDAVGNGDALEIFTFGKRTVAYELYAAGNGHALEFACNKCAFFYGNNTARNGICGIGLACGIGDEFGLGPC